MDEECLWALFFATGLPEVYLAVCAHRGEQERLETKTAFVPLETDGKLV